MILDFNPELQDGDIVIASAGQTGEDIILSPLARGLLPISIECKNVERLNIWKAIEQSEANSKHFQSVVFFRRNRSKLYAVVPGEEYLELLRLRYETEREEPKGTRQ